MHQTSCSNDPPPSIPTNDINPPTNQTYVAGQPVYGGVNDPRLGDLHDPGYLGHIELARPVYHQGFIDVTLKALRCVCFHCSRIKMEEGEYKFQMCRKIRNRKRRLDAM
jgi:DNA-directed RNA polymerase II subunit RPB1